MRRRAHAIQWAGLAVALLAGLYLGLKVSRGGHDTGEIQSSTYRLSISEARPGEGFPKFRTTQGHTITLLISSDRLGSAHVHGYEKEIDLKPGGEVTLTFTANEAGLFPLHLHNPDGSMRHLATVEVEPK